jgi:hypothetical protein
MTTKPIYTGIINGHPVRFFKTPMNDGKPDFAWHSTEDLMRAANLDTAMIEYFMRSTPSDQRSLYRTVATPDGLVTIAPHCVAQGFTGAMVAVGKAPASFPDEYHTAAFEADDKLPLKGFDEIIGAYHRHSGAITTPGGVP